MYNQPDGRSAEMSITDCTMIPEVNMELKLEKVLVTGAAGFIGCHLSKRLLDNGCQVAGVDNLNSYYDVGLKKDRLKTLMNFPKFAFHRIDLSDREGLETIFKQG